MLTLRSILRPTRRVHAHCDIPCGVYDPEQAGFGREPKFPRIRSSL